MPLAVSEATHRIERVAPVVPPPRTVLHALVLRRTRPEDTGAPFEAYAGDTAACRWMAIRRIPRTGPSA